MIKLEPNDKTQWLAALRGGRYLQIDGYLASRFDETRWGHDGIGFCCLGVYCRVNDVDLYDILDEEISDLSSFVECPALRQDKKVLPAGAIEPDDDNGVTIADYLANLNDHRKPFSYIADWIEKYL